MILSPVLTNMQLPVHVSGLAYLFLKFFGGSKPMPLRNVIGSSIYVRHCFGKDGPVLFRSIEKRYRAHRCHQNTPWTGVC